MYKASLGLPARTESPTAAAKSRVPRPMPVQVKSLFTFAAPMLQQSFRARARPRTRTGPSGRKAIPARKEQANSVFTLFTRPVLCQFCHFAGLAGGHDLAREQFVAVFLVAGQRLLDDAEGGVGGTNLLDLHLLAFELLVILEEALQDQ